jgi:hypothetical protein
MARYSIGVESDEQLRNLLASAKSIAVVGIKDGPHDDAFEVPQYLQRAGYRIVPVNPKLERVLGEPVVRSLPDLDRPVDLIDLFRAPAHIPAHTDEILALPQLPQTVWMQLGISHPESAQRLEQAGIQVVQDRCIMVEHRRLCGAG